MSSEHPVIAAQVPVDEPPPSATIPTERPITPPPTRFSHKSSPTKKGNFYAWHKLEQVQQFGYREETHKKKDFETADDLLKFLGTPTFDELPNGNFSAKIPLSTFLGEANSMSKSIKETYFQDHPGGLVVFKNTEHKKPRGHVTDTECRPDITAAFERHFDAGTTFWPCIHIAGEWASKGTSREQQEKKAISYLHYLLLARPDLYVAQGMLASDSKIMFLVGIGGFGVRCLEIPWDHNDLSKVLYAFIFRAYRPGRFKDPSYELDPIVFKEDNRPTWTITLQIESQVGGAPAKRTVPCPNFVPLYASNPFDTRTHVLATPGKGVNVDGKTLTVIKDQTSRIHKRFDEHEILKLVHEPKKVPGVVEAVYYKCINLPAQLDDLDIGRVKHRHGLCQLGSPFASIPTVKDMLQAAFDTIEVLRFLRVERKILHRDVSTGNVMYIPPSDDKQDSDTSTQDYEVLLFSESFLSDSPRCPPRTLVLLVDFNYAEHLTSKTDDCHQRGERTGTALFMARAVELGRPLDFPERVQARFLDPIPSAPDRYAERYSDTRMKKFPPKPWELFIKPERVKRPHWRHELDHDIESVFWLMLYWAMTAQPEGEAAEHISAAEWNSLTGSVEQRHGLLKNLSDQQSIAKATFHPTFQPLAALLKQLAGILTSIDRHWLDRSEKRNDPEYFAEAFQRLILEFLIQHNGISFMNQKIASNPREAERHGIEVARSSTNNQRSHAASQSKRASNTDEQSDPKPKRPRTTQEPVTDRSSGN